MNKLRIGGQSIIEYVVILAVVALASILFVPYIQDLFIGYKYTAIPAMQKGLIKTPNVRVRTQQSLNQPKQPDFNQP